MAINVKHGVNATSFAAASFAAGQGETRQKYLSAQLADQSRRRAVESERVYRDEVAKTEADRRATETEKSRDYQKDVVKNERDWQQGQTEDARKYAEQQSLVAQDRRRDDLEYELSAKQRAEFNKMSESYDEAVRSGEYTPEELSLIQREMLTKQAGITALPRMGEFSPWPKGQRVGETWESDDKRFIMTRDKDGTVKKVAETNAVPTFQDRNDAWKTALEMSKSKTKNAADGSTSESIDINAARKFYDEIMNGSQPSSMGGPAPLAASTSTAKDPKRSVLNADEAELTDAINAVAKRKGLDPSAVRAMVQKKVQYQPTQQEIEENNQRHKAMADALRKVVQ